MGSFPEDMEDRRLADLQKFALNHPDHPMVPRLMQQVSTKELAEPEAEGELGESKEGSWYHWLREQQLILASKRASKGKRQSSGKQGAINKWDKASSLELLAELKKFQETLIALSLRGIRVTSDSRWAAIAQNLPNRCGLEPVKFARSCKVHFLSLGRVYRERKKNSKGKECLDAQVRQALEDYFQLGGGNAPSPPPRKVLEATDSVGREQNGKNATNFEICTISTEKIYRGDTRAKVAAAVGKNTCEKASNMMSEKIANGCSPWLNPTVNPTIKRNRALYNTKHEISNESQEGPAPRPRFNANTKRMKTWESPVSKSSDCKGHRAAKANEDPHELEELGNPQRQDQRLNPTMESATLKRWESPVFESSDGTGPKVVEAHEDPFELEELGNPRQRAQCVNPTMDSAATFKKWDTSNSVELLTTIAKMGAKGVHDRQTVASLVPNHENYVHSCKKQHQDLLRNYKKGKWKENSGHKRLADEVNAQLEKLLQSSKTLKTDTLKNEKFSRVEKRGMASQRATVNPPFSPPVGPPVIEKFGDEWRGSTKTCGLNKKIYSGAVATNHKKAGFVTANNRLQNRKGLGHLPISIPSESNGNNSMSLDSDDDSEMKWDEYRKMIKKRSRKEQQDEGKPESPVTGKKGITGAAERMKSGMLQEGDAEAKGICKTYIDLLESRNPLSSLNHSIPEAQTRLMT